MVMNGAKFKHRGFESGVTSDAPFIGLRISALDCHMNCPGCHNQHLKTRPILESNTKAVLNMLEATINEGVILGGLEWTNQPTEMLNIIEDVTAAGHLVMLYTGLDRDHFKKVFPQLWGVPGVWVKYGTYDSARDGRYEETFDVHLASDNQHIEYLGGRQDE